MVKRRYSTGHSAVESFEKIKKNNWHIYGSKTRIPYSQDAYSEVFLNDRYYIAILPALFHGLFKE